MAQYTPGPWKRREARARLIAAAPDLLTALRELLDRVEASPEALNMARHQMDAGRAAIAKAEGSAVR